MPVHQLWMLLPVKALCVGELVAYISFLEHKVQKQAPASLNFLHQLPKGLLSFPSHLFYPCPAPFIFMNLLSILLSFGVVSLYSGIYARQSDREKSVFEAHFPPRPAPIYFWLANNVILRAGELCSFHFIGRRTHKLESDGDDIETCLKKKKINKIFFFAAKRRTPEIRHGAGIL